MTPDIATAVLLLALARARTPADNRVQATGCAECFVAWGCVQVVREASKRVLGLRPFDVQCIGGMILHEGQIAEMRTGEVRQCS